MCNRIIVLLTTLLYSCATPPSGEPQLAAMIAKDQLQSADMAPKIKEGRPLYLRVYAHPQIMPSGDIWGGGPIMLFVGRETLSLDTMLKQ